MLEDDGEHVDTLNLKRKGLGLIVDLARVHALAIGEPQVNTQSRLRAVAAAAGGSAPRSAADLAGAMEFIAQVRLRHQASQVRTGRAPDNYVRPDELSSFEKRHLRDAFQVVKQGRPSWRGPTRCTTCHDPAPLGGPAPSAPARRCTGGPPARLPLPSPPRPRDPAARGSPSWPSTSRPRAWTRRRDEILSIGFVPVDGLRIVLAGARQLLVRGAAVGQSATIHGLTDDTVASGLDLADALAAVLEALRGRVLLAHHAAIERDFLGSGLQTRSTASPLPCVTVDTLELEHRLLSPGWGRRATARGACAWALRASATGCRATAPTRRSPMPWPAPSSTSPRPASWAAAAP